MRLARVLSVVVVLGAPSLAFAAIRYAVAPQPGLACASLNMTDQQAMDPSFIVPLRSAPSASAPAVGQAGSIVLIRYPRVEENGYLSAVLLNGRQGWILASAVRVWQSPGGGSHRCIPSRMSDGSLGFAFK